jgi:hypothetical protein
VAQIEQVILFEMGEKFPHIRGDGFARDTELTAQFVGNLRFCAALSQQLQNARAHNVRAKHLPVKDVQNNGAVLVVG